MCLGEGKPEAEDAEYLLPKFVIKFVIKMRMAGGILLLLRYSLVSWQRLISLSKGISNSNVEILEKEEGQNVIILLKRDNTWRHPPRVHSY